MRNSAPGAAVRAARPLPRPAARRLVRPDPADGAVPAADVRRHGRRRRLRRRPARARARRAPVAVARASALAGLAWVLMACAVWSIVFGVLFGELFGDLGTRVFGDWALWHDRLAADALVPLLLFAVGIGAAHVVLGLGLGAWQAIRFGERRRAARQARHACSSSAASSASPAGRPTSCRRRADAVGCGDGRRARAGMSLARGARPRHRAARAAGQARERPVLPAARRGRPGVGASRERRERAGDRRTDLDGRRRRRLLSRAQPRPGVVQPD